ncbi:hypothetical protein D0469_07015 [Peribacillus saganii]|uniref:Uncharacterized protein n=1 Tax=Peribacillus saganii TaxID=2303992 RepID=A0A372LS22_9BACI|nr:hypothetical protein [Peribacillus saganii]RFU70344.1 hypothetical protein D0469_07015 [Peribacillus saganii]
MAITKSVVTPKKPTVPNKPTITTYNQSNVQTASSKPNVTIDQNQPNPNVTVGTKADGTKIFYQTGTPSGGGGGGGSSKPKTSSFNQQAYTQQYQNQINSMYDRQREAQLNQLRATRDRAVGEINQQKQQVAPQYQTMRNQSDVVNTQQVQRLRETMAANGLQASGENVTAQTGLANQRQSNLNSLNLQEQQTMNDLNRRITDLNNPAEENALIANLEAERARALLDIGMRADEIGYSRSRDAVMDGRYADETNYNRGRDSVADQRYADETTYNRGQDQKQWDYQSSRDKLNDYWRQREYDASRYDLRKEWDYRDKRDRVSDEQWQKQYDAGRYDRAKDVEWRKITYNNMSASERAQLEWNKRQYGEDMAWRMFELEYNGELAQSQSQAELDFYGNNPLNFLP